MKVVVATNNKGGSTKSALASNLAACWGQGQRTLLVDLDEQGDASMWLGVEDTGERLANALTRRGSLADAVVATPSGVDVAPGGEALGHIAGSVTPDAVTTALAAGSVTDYAFVVIDCPPSLSRIVRSAWCVPNAYGLIPVDGPAALKGAARVFRMWTEWGLGADQLHVVLVRQDGRRLIHRALEEQARSIYGDAVLRTKVRDSVIVPESSGWRRPLVLHAPEHKVTADMRRLAQEVSHG
jgi:chromosome partitioning protein